LNIGKAGVLMLTYLFLVFIAWVVLSTPFESLVAGFEGLGGLAGDELDSQISRSRTVFNMFFAGMGVVPLVWFLIWIMRREPDWRFR